MTSKTIHIVIDEKTINTNDPQGVVQPLWGVSIYDGEEQYENDLKPFTLPQRYVFAIQWYDTEVCNGGHCQFYNNSTGIVWEDALKGFEEIGVIQNVEIIKESAARMGGSPSKTREERQSYLDNHDIDFDDLDDLYFESKNDMWTLLNSYITKNAKDFYFSGDVTIPA